MLIVVIAGVPVSSDSRGRTARAETGKHMKHLKSDWMWREGKGGV